MWSKIFWQIVKMGVVNVPWEAIAQGLLDIVKKKIKEANITLDDLQPKDILEDVEVFLAKTLGVKVDLDGDGAPGE